MIAKLSIIVHTLPLRVLLSLPVNGICTNLLISFLYMCMFPAGCFRQGTYMAHSLINGLLNET